MRAMDSRIKTEDIDFGRKYTGYLWMSNSAEPAVLAEPGFVDRALFERRNPFVAGGQLYDSDNAVSLSIRYADGEYFIVRYENASGPADAGDCDDVVYAGVRMTHDGKSLLLRFRRYWRLEPDDACLGMKAPSVDREVFLGFATSSGAD